MSFRYVPAAAGTARLVMCTWRGHAFGATPGDLSALGVGDV